MESEKTPHSFSHVEVSYIKAVSGGNSLNIFKYITLFINNLPLQINKIQQALSHNDPQLLSAALHTLRGQFQFMGIAALLKQTEQTEILLKQKGEINDEIIAAVNSVLTGIKPAVDELEQIKLQHQ